MRRNDPRKLAALTLGLALLLIPATLLAQRGGGFQHRGGSMGDLSPIDRLAERGALLKEVLAVRRELLDPQDLAIAATLDRLASYHRLVGDLAEARQLYREALAMVIATLGEKHHLPGFQREQHLIDWRHARRFGEKLSLFPNDPVFRNADRDVVGTFRQRAGIENLIARIIKPGTEQASVFDDVHSCSAAQENVDGRPAGLIQIRSGFEGTGKA